MEWEFKMSPWDISELEQNTGEVNLSSVVGSSGSRTGDLNCSVDLKLGGFGDFEMSDKWVQNRGFEMPMEMSVTVASGGQLKRPRVPSGGGSPNVSCLVDGCRNDLSHCREYHRRHKVCEVHSKTPIVLVGGQEQRFCQQCSRFHLLAEFDEVKRSCRKRLDGHNRRRRKPQPDLIPGTRFPTHPQTFQIATTDSTWSAMVKSEEDGALSSNPPLQFINMTPPPPQHLSSSLTWRFKEGKQLPFLEDGEMTLGSRTPMEPAADIQSPFKTISSAPERKITFSNSLPKPHLESDRALSLLSSSTHTPCISLGHEMSVHRIAASSQPVFSSLEYGIGVGLYSHFQATSNPVVDKEQVSNVMVSDTIEGDLHCHRIFQVDGEGTSNVASQSLPFSWY